MIVPRVYLIDLPCDIKGYTVQNLDGEQVIVLNARLNWEQNLKSYEHELRHENDFGKYDSADQLEYMRHKG